MWGHVSRGLSMRSLRFVLGQSRMLNRSAPSESTVPQLGPQLPSRLTQQPWHLLYSTGRDGFSLRTLYRSGARPDSPALLLIRDTEAQVRPCPSQPGCPVPHGAWAPPRSFGRTGTSPSAGSPSEHRAVGLPLLPSQAFGAFSGSAIRSSSGFYGTGETFLFSFCPELKVRLRRRHLGAGAGHVPSTGPRLGVPAVLGVFWGEGAVLDQTWGQQAGDHVGSSPPGLSRPGGRRQIPGSAQEGRLREGDPAQLGVTGFPPHGRAVAAQLWADRMWRQPQLWHHWGSVCVMGS